MRRHPVSAFARALFPLGTYDEENGASAEVMKIESRFKVCRSASCKRMRVGSQPFAPAAAAARRRNGCRTPAYRVFVLASPKFTVFSTPPLC